MTMMDIRPLRTEADYDAALKEIDRYFENKPARGTPEGDRFEILLALIGAYEQEHWRIDPPMIRLTQSSRSWSSRT